MKKTNYWAQDEKTKVNSKLPKCAAETYHKPDINKICTKINFDDEFFVPKYKENHSTADLFVNIIRDVHGYQIGIPSSGQFTVDCGFSLTISEGYKVCFSLDSELLNKGLIINGSNQIEVCGEDTRVKINVHNMSDKILILSHKEKLGRIWIEPVYFFDWRT